MFVCFIMSKVVFAFITRGRIREEWGYSVLADTGSPASRYIVKVGAKRIFDKKVIIKISFFPQYKTHTLSGTSDIQATDNKQMEGRGLL